MSRRRDKVCTPRHVADDIDSSLPPHLGQPPSRLPPKLHLGVGFKAGSVSRRTERTTKTVARKLAVVTSRMERHHHCTMACLVWIASELGSATSLPKANIIPQKPQPEEDHGCWLGPAQPIRHTPRRHSSAGLATLGLLVTRNWS